MIVNGSSMAKLLVWRTISIHLFNQNVNQLMKRNERKSSWATIFTKITEN
jgi:hypothetical protein